MHGLFENIAHVMLCHWCGTFFKGSQDESSDYVLPQALWKDMGKIMDSNRKNMPLDFGWPPIDIQRHSAAFKAEDWSNYTHCHCYRTSFQKGKTNEVRLSLFKESHALGLSLSDTWMDGQDLYMRPSSASTRISKEELDDIARLFCKFVKHYERYTNCLFYYWAHFALLIFWCSREYLRKEPECLPAALISFHYLLHIGDSIRNSGPAWATWQYPMVRLCGMLLPLVRSRQHPYTNLRNQITARIRF